MNEKLLEIKDLYVEYNTDEADVHALNGFSLSIGKGEKIGIVGETGAGKTTMALSILRLLPEKIGNIKSGEILYEGRDILKLSKHEVHNLRGNKISMIFQDPMTSLDPVMTVGEQVYEVLDLHDPGASREEKDRQVDEIFKMVGIPPDRKNEYPHQFSGGMKQRIVIAMALIAEPELLLADEPTTALDVTIQAQILELMRRLSVKFQSAMMLITHDLGVVAEFCDKVAIVYAGEVIENGTVEEVYAREDNHPYTAGLFKCIPDLTSNVERLSPIEGYMADPTNLPKGCKFAPRCPKCTEKCKEIQPTENMIGNHMIKCHLYNGKGEQHG